MTVHVLTTSSSAGPGKARRTPLLGTADRRAKVAVYNFQYGTDVYVDGGTDISALWDDFGDIYYIGIEQKDTSDEANRRKFAVDYANKKIVVYTAVNTEDTGNDLSVVALRLLVVGTT